jgi:DNA-binding CsgD family transcriptional regulator
LPQTEKMASFSTGSAAERRLLDRLGIQCLTAEQPLASDEVGAAMQELNGLVTALLFHIGSIQRNSDRFADAGHTVESFKQAVESACHVAERICSLTHRIDDFVEMPVPKEATIGTANAVLGSWSGTRDHDDKSRHEADHHSVEESGRAAAKPLTRREREVLRLVSEGHSNKEGAKLMNISHRTFECHRAEVMRKLGARNTAELVRLVLLDTIRLAPPLEQTGA